MVNPGTFRGKRGEFLKSQYPFYKQAVKDNKASDAILKIIRGYFKRFPPQLGMVTEPSNAAMESVDDDAMDDECSPPRREDYVSGEGEGSEDAAEKKFEDAMTAYLAAGALEKELIPVRRQSPFALPD